MKSTSVHLRGDLIAVVGDTPAMAKVGGFKEGVGFTLRKCHHCMAYGSQMQAKVCKMCKGYCNII